jgi:hypothetical protein
MLIGLGLTGCPAGAALDTPYEQYDPTLGGTTGGNALCDNDNVNVEAMNYWCGTATCHGTEASSETAAPLWLFGPDRTTSLLDLPAVTEDCTTELIVDTTTPENSLIIRSMRHTSPCGLEMPDGIDIEPDALACIEAWVNGLVDGT